MVAVHEVGIVAGAVFVAMEHVVGVDLRRWLDDKPRRDPLGGQPCAFLVL